MTVRKGEAAWSGLGGKTDYVTFGPAEGDTWGDSNYNTSAIETYSYGVFVKVGSMLPFSFGGMQNKIDAHCCFLRSPRRYSLKDLSHPFACPISVEGDGLDPCAIKLRKGICRI
jgi:hypothetical protein